MHCVRVHAQQPWTTCCAQRYQSSQSSDFIRDISPRHLMNRLTEAATREAILSPAIVRRGRPAHKTSHPVLWALYDGVSRNMSVETKGVSKWIDHKIQRPETWTNGSNVTTCFRPNVTKHCQTDSKFPNVTKMIKRFQTWSNGSNVRDIASNRMNQQEDTGKRASSITGSELDKELNNDNQRMRESPATQSQQKRISASRFKSFGGSRMRRNSNWLQRTTQSFTFGVKNTMISPRRKSLCHIHKSGKQIFWI